MLILSRKDLEALAVQILRDALPFPLDNGTRCIPIEQLARYYLGLETRYEKLCDWGELIGLTTFAGIMLKLRRNLREETITVEADTILLDESLNPPEMKPRRRFTVAHECAHQILSRYEEAIMGHSRRSKFQLGQTYSCRELSNKSDWEEWQANVLASVLLMPKTVVEYVLELCGVTEVFHLNGNKPGDFDEWSKYMKAAKTLGVSKQALAIRLWQLGYAEQQQMQYMKCG